MPVRASTFAPLLLSVLRLMSGLLFAEHGTQKLLAFPAPYASGIPALGSLTWFSGIIELVCGLLVAVGFMTRPAAFLASGMCAVGYFMVHAPRGFFPILNGGETIALYCFVFLYLAAAGGGPWSVDARIRKAS